MGIKINFATLLLPIIALSSVAYASNITLQGAINKYKAGNYSGCIQDLEQYTQNERSNALAYYYLAIANVQAGRKTPAINAYDKVLALKPDDTLYDYATKGKVCLENPDLCYKNNSIKETDTELDKFIKDKNQFVYKNAPQNNKEKDLNTLKNRINSGEKISAQEFNEYEKYSQPKTQKTETKITTNNRVNDKMPSNDEVVEAIRILNKAGLGNIVTQQPTSQNNQQNMAQQQQQQQMMQAMMMMQQNPYGNISSMLGGNNNNNNNSNNQFLNMLPMLLTQSGQNGGNNAMSPEVIQAMMMNSMIPDLTFSSNDNK